MPFPGDRLGPFEIVSLLGKGGMGEVWKGRDPLANRDVAIKVSAVQFTDRFEREARAIGALNHKNVCILYFVGPNYLVMELIEGPTLAERIAQGPIPLDEALGIAKQIADALEAAHEKAITHRDLKPANVKIRPDGTVKVLDFGLAKAASEEVELTSESPTMLPGTQAGMILGTAGYMSPEQARAQKTDKRADIWAFGVVLYEMVTGKRLFDGATVSDSLAAILKEEPDLTRVPEKVRRLLRACLQKDPRDRLQAIGDWKLLLAEEAPASSAPSRSRFGKAGWMAAGAFAVLAAVLAFLYFRQKPPEPAASMRFQIAPPANANLGTQMSISPDGRMLAFNAGGMIWVRPLDSLESRSLPGTENNGQPFFWSPDSRFIAYSGRGKLLKVEVAGGPPQTICDAPNGVVGGTWNRDGGILFGQTAGGLMRVSEGGGIAAPVTTLDAANQEINHILPQFLPDGRHFIYWRGTTGSSTTVIYLGSLDGRPPDGKRLLASPFGAAWAPSASSPSGHILFMREGTLLAQRFDPSRLELSGDPVPIAEGVGTFLGHGYFSASATGTLTYRKGAVSSGWTLKWFDRSGKGIGSAGVEGDNFALALSPDGGRVAVSVNRSGNQDIWVIDLARKTNSRLTSNPNADTAPVWSPDGTRIAFQRQGNVYQRLASGAGAEELLARGSVWDWTRDGRFLLLGKPDANNKEGLWLLPVEPSGQKREATPFLAGAFNEDQAQVSPDGRWLAYVSDESGKREIYVKPFSPGGSAGTDAARTKVSEGGGSYPRWRRDGKELFYLDLQQLGVNANLQLLAVDVTAGTAFKAGIPAPLFRTWTRGFGPFPWDVSADGQRFLIATNDARSPGAVEEPFTIVTNWESGLLKK